MICFIRKDVGDLTYLVPKNRVDRFDTMINSIHDVTSFGKEYYRLYEILKEDYGDCQFDGDLGDLEISYGNV